METLPVRTLELTVDGRKRHCAVYVPATLDPAHPVPLLLSFHGASGTGVSMIKKFRALADRDGFLLAAPDGLGKRWNAGLPEEIEATGNADEPAFVDAILDALNKDYSIDPRRIYACGFSNGAALCQVLAIRPESQLAAIACVGATLPAASQKNLAAAPPVSVLLLVGSDDEFFAPDGSKLRWFLPAHETARLWAEHNKCSPADSPAEFTYWLNRETGTEVQFGWITGGKHSWKLSPSLDTSATVWQFLRSHTKTWFQPEKKVTP